MRQDDEAALKEFRQARDSKRRNINVPLWEETDVSDIDCTPTYDTSALDEKIRIAQIKCQSLAKDEGGGTERDLIREEDGGGGGGGGGGFATNPQDGLDGSCGIVRSSVELREPYHINVLEIAERICHEMDVPFGTWREAHAPHSEKKEPAFGEKAVQASVGAQSASSPKSSVVGGRSSSGSHFGPDMFQGEGEAMAAFVASGQRIPRRGEVGWSPEDIERFERSGFVMSGNRNRRITNVRIRKEAEVYSAEQQRALSLYNYELRAQRERAVAEELQNLLSKVSAACVVIPCVNLAEVCGRPGSLIMLSP